MQKINLIIVGSCTAEDILESNKADKNNFFQIKSFTGSINRSFSKPGKLAHRLLDHKEFYKSISEISPRHQRNIKRQINLITKETTALSLLDEADKNSVVIIDAAYELTPFFNDSIETFDLIHNYFGLQKHLPQWLTNEIEKNTYVFDSGIKEFAFQSIKNYKKFFSIIEERQLACIVMGNTFTRKVYDKNTNSVGHIIPLYNKCFHRIFNKNNLNDDLEIFDYNQKLVDINYKILFDINSGKNNIFHIDLDNVYSDLDHPYGYHPAHYHITCRKMLYNQLKKMIINTHISHKEKLNLLSLPS
jgi:hypothetical protein